MINGTLANQTLEEAVVQGIVAGMTTTVMIMILVFVLIFVAAFYVYHALAWRKIAKRKNYSRPWFAWIPFASTAMRLQMGRFHWALTFLWLIPILGWIAIYVLVLISHWRIFESLKYPGWLALLQLADLILNGIGSLAYLVVIGIIAWKEPEKITPIKRKSKKKVSKKKRV